MRNHLRAASAAGLVFLLTSPALADVKSGIDAWEREDYAAAIAAWTPLAEKGDADAQFNLGQAYRFGRGVPLDLKQAENWYRRAAVQGHIQAEDNLGLVLFQNGDRLGAMPLIRKSADRGDARAQFVLGTAFFNGDLAPKDWPSAYAYMVRAANSGLDRARLRLTEFDSFLSAEDRQKGLILAQQMDAKAPPPGISLLPARALAPARLATRDQALPPPVMPDPKPSAAAAPSMAAPVSPPATPSVVAPPPPARHAAPAASPAPPAPPTRRTTVAAGWRVQLGAFGDAAKARSLWQHLRQHQPLIARLSPSFETSGGLTRLRAGPVTSAAEAARLCNTLAKAGQPCMVIQP
ncbi:MAG: SPOR domain-containing protein [Chakrabartia sp.]